MKMSVETWQSPILHAEWTSKSLNRKREVSTSLRAVTLTCYSNLMARDEFKNLGYAERPKPEKGVKGELHWWSTPDDALHDEMPMFTIDVLSWAFPSTPYITTLRISLQHGMMHDMGATFCWGWWVSASLVLAATVRGHQVWVVATSTLCRRNRALYL